VMSIRSRNVRWSFAVLALGALICACSDPNPLARGATGGKITFSKGELLQLVSATYVKGKSGELRNYFSKAFPLAREHGYTPLIQFQVNEVLAGTYRPEGFIGLYKWPGTAAADQFERDPRWAPIKATRPDVFQELRVSTFALDADLPLVLKDGHVYEIQLLWMSQENPGAYQRYTEAVEDALGRAGGRVLARFKGGKYESVQPWPRQPDQIVILDWPSATARSHFVSSSAFLDNKQLLYSAVADEESFLTTANPYN
jgi:uncharacterized protein (DUF1330 family)